jgi:hypothetical protein
MKLPLLKEARAAWSARYKGAMWDDLMADWTNDDTVF